MEVQIRDTAALRRISPPMLRAYLGAQGWVHEETWRGRIVVWSKTGDHGVKDLLMPLREHSDAYAVRIAEAVALLAEMEERSQLDIYYDLLGAGADTIRLRALNGAGQTGWDFNDSVTFLTHARDLMTSAARFAERPGQAVYRGRASGMVTDYVRAIRPLPGYTGGNELTLHSPVPAGYGVQADFGDDVKPPFPRLTTLALHDGLGVADNMVAEVLGGANIAATFAEAAPRGVSANLCDAVATLARQGHGIGISLSWAHARPTHTSAEEFVFSESSAEVFAEAVKWLRLNSPFLDAHITGEIVRLYREPHEEFDGQAVMMYELDGRPVALQVQFAIADRDEVVRAFQDGVEVSLDGDIHRTGNKYQVRNLRNFTCVQITQ